MVRLCFYRQRCYNCVLNALTHLLITRQSRANASNVPSRPGPPSPPDENTLTSEEAERYVCINKFFEQLRTFGYRYSFSMATHGSSSFSWLSYFSFTTEVAVMYNDGCVILLKRISFYPINIFVILWYACHLKFETWLDACKNSAMKVVAETKLVVQEGRGDLL